MRSLFSLLFLVLFISLASAGYAQGLSPQSESHILHYSEDMMNLWGLRESRVEHPVVQNLEHVKEHGLNFYYDPQYELRAKTVIQFAQEAKEMTMRFLPEAYVTDINIYLLDNINRYFEAQQSMGRAPEWAAGLAILRDGVILIRLKPNAASLIEPERTLAHELNHVALKRWADDNPLPHWFYEGFAMLSTESWNMHRAEIMVHASITGRLIPLDQITHGFPAQGAMVDLAYAQSSHFVSWILRQWGEDKFHTFLERLHKGENFKEAFDQNYGIALSSVEADWRDTLIERNSWMAPFVTAGTVLLFFGGIIVLALGIMKTKRRRRALSNIEALPLETLPQNLRHFGPFNP